MNRRSKIARIYKKFCEAEGNQHIASEFAILKLDELVRKNNVKRILEIGLGIGSIAGCLLQSDKSLEYYGTESNSFCRKALRENLGNDYNKLKILDNLLEIPNNLNFDLIIIDGKDQDLRFIPEFLSESGIIAIEGDRSYQEKLMLNSLSRSLSVHCISLKKNRYNSPFSASNWQGGIKVIFSNPSFGNYGWWVLEKVKSKIKYQYPGRYLGKKSNGNVYNS